MNESQSRRWAESLAAEIYADVFALLDADPWIDGETAGRIATLVQSLVREELSR